MVLEKMKREDPSHVQLKKTMDEMGFDSTQKNWVYKLTSQRFERTRMVQMLDIARGAYRHIERDLEPTRLRVLDELISSYNTRYFFHNFTENRKNSETTELINQEIDAESLTLEERFTVLKILADLVVNGSSQINPFKIEKRGSTLKDAGFIVKRESRLIH
ncbi:MAG: hypothetical protein KGH71_01115 [Candidatus Micrarchaeota archaeon]|nr:hypothetical protein [Candidatus Micrarchaeota archaeon]